MMQRALALLVALGGLFVAGAGANPLPPMIDAHAHYAAPDAAAFTPAEVIARLDAAGVRRLVVTSSPPQLAQQLYQHAPDRVIPLLGVYGSDLHKANWVHDAGLPARAAAQMEDGVWAGIGELHLFARDERIAPRGALLPPWRALFERHPERFVVAVDTFSVNRWQQYETVVTQIRS